MNENQNPDNPSNQAVLDTAQDDELNRVTEHLMSIEATSQPEQHTGEGRMQQYFNTAKYAGLSALVLAEVTPFNELSRLGIFGLAEAYSRSPIVGGLAAGLSTLAIEGISGLATASLLDHPKSTDVINKVNERGKKLGVPMDRELSVGTKTFWTFMGGTPVGMLLEQREDPTRTIEQNRRYSLLTSAWQAGVLGVAGAMASEGINVGLEDPKRGALLAGGLAAVATAGNWMRKKGKNLLDKRKEKRLQEQFEGYEKITKEYGRLSPQHQGMNYEEYTSAVGDSDVVLSDVEVDGKKIRFPQLSPVNKYGWLNTDFYAKKFPEQANSGNLLHFNAIPNIDPSPEVDARVTELARNGGVLVFDAPSSDPEYMNRVLSYLESIGVQAEEPELIGTQTYFAGQSRLINRVGDNTPVEDYKTSYAKLVAEGKTDPTAKDGPSLRENIGAQEAQAMREFYDAAYTVLNDHPCNQGLDPDQFYSMVTQQDEVTKIVNSVNGEVVALLLLDNNLDELDWVNADYYREHFPEKTETGQVVWFPGLAANPEKTQGHNLQAMVDLICQVAENGNNDMVVVFDCCDFNTGFLDVALNRFINKSPQARIDIKAFADQKYYAIKTSLKQ